MEYTEIFNDAVAIVDGEYKTPRFKETEKIVKLATRMRSKSYELYESPDTYTILSALLVNKDELAQAMQTIADYEALVDVVWACGKDH